MADLVKYDKRIALPKGAQKKFIESVQLKLGSNLDYIADKIEIHRKTLFDWKREKYLISEPGINRLSKLSGLPVPQNIKIKDPFWYTHLGAKAGAKKAAAAMIQKYGYIGGDPEHRKKRWREWWEKEGKFKKHPIINVCKSFNKPKPSEELAEFVGIMMGDGGMSKRQIRITLHHIDDLKFSQYVRRLIKKLFNIDPGFSHDIKNSVNNIVVSRTELVKYLNNLGLVVGNKVKQKFDIPGWIKQNDKYLKRCVRGLVDTDGSVFLHRYNVAGKPYSYKKLSFTSASPPLVATVLSVLQRWGFRPRITKDNRQVRLDSKSDMERYFKVIGSSNPKHLKKYQN